MERLLDGIILSIGMFLGGWACELMVAEACSCLLKPTGVPAYAGRRFWTALVQCHCGFMVITALLSAVDGFSILAGPTLLAHLPVVAVLWWWINLCRAISARSEPGWRRAVVFLLIPVLGGLSVAAPGFFVLVTVSTCR